MENDDEDDENDGKKKRGSLSKSIPNPPIIQNGSTVFGGETHKTVADLKKDKKPAKNNLEADREIAKLKLLKHEQEMKVKTLKNKKSIYAKIPYLAVIFNGILLVSIFTITIYQSFNYAADLDWIIHMYYNLGKRLSVATFAVNLARDTILNNGTYKSYGGSVLFDQYLETLDDLESSVDKLSNSVTPSQFETYSKSYNNLRNGDLCKLYKQDTSQSLLPNDNCIIDNNPILTKGESVSIVSIIHYCRESVLKFIRSTSTTTAANMVPLQKSVLLGSEMNIVYTIKRALNLTISREITLFEEAWTKTNNVYINWSVPLFIGLIIYLVLTLISYLVRTLKDFGRRVSYNKGLLSLIPHETIASNPNLKQCILEGELKQLLQ